MVFQPWMAKYKIIMKNYILSFGLITLFAISSCANAKSTPISNMNNSDTYLRLSEQLVIASKNNARADKIINSLALVEQDVLAAELYNDVRKKTFWINIYNAMVQIILTKNPEKFEDRSAFYGEKQITIANKTISLDEIEHGIIRGSKLKLSLGLVKDPFAGDYEKKFRVEKTDGRVHFALNCGAISCPYVAIYDYTKFDEQIDKSCKIYLQKDTKVKGDVVYVSILFSWFRGDFDGTGGIIKLLKKYEVISQDLDPKLEYNDYDWTLKLGNFIEL
jgi:hypothetical protein